MIRILFCVGIFTGLNLEQLFSSMLIFKVAIPDCFVVIWILFVLLRQAHECLLWICVEKQTFFHRRGFYYIFTCACE